VQAWREKNRPTSREQRLRWNEDNPTKVLVSSAKQRAARAGVPFDLGPDDVVIPERCPVLGIPLRKSRGGAASAGSPSVDRVVPHLGYVKGNVVVMSHRANMIKNDASLSELEAITSWLRSRASTHPQAAV
jgi:hypothetical protein